MRASGEHLASAAFAASVLVVLAGYASWLPFANGVDSPVRSGVLLWPFAAACAFGAASLLRGWRPGIYVAFGVAFAWSIVTTGGALLTWAYLNGPIPGSPGTTPSPGTALWFNAMLPLLLIGALSAVSAWLISKLLPGDPAVTLGPDHG